MRWFRGNQAAESKTDVKTGESQRAGRRSTGFAEFTRSLNNYKNLSVLDLGATSPANIAFLTAFNGRFHNEDLLRASQDKTYLRRQEDGQETIDVQKFFDENLNYPELSFDAVLCWDVPDFLNEALVRPMVERLHTIMKPGGILLAFFHTKDAGPDYCRYHIVSGEVVDLEPKPGFSLQRVFNNRHIENLFHGFSSLKFFLGRDNIREVLVIR
jgi:SAM-dependent methyltransferase